jgi:hypothetical protein
MLGHQLAQNSQNFHAHPLQQGYGADVAKDEPANVMVGLHYRLKAATEQAALTNDRLQRIVSRAFGDPLPGDVNQAPKQVPAGTVGMVSEQMEELLMLLAEQSKLLGRLDTLV